MSNRSGNIKSGATSRIKTDSQFGSRDRVAAKEEDIKAFSSLLSERKRLSERTNQDNNDKENELAHPNQIRDSNEHIGQPSLSAGSGLLNDALQKQKTVADETNEPRINANTVQKLELTVARSAVQESAKVTSQNGMEKLVAVIQRIVLKQNSNEPRQWQISLKIDDQQTLDISLEYFGKDEWRVGVVGDEQKDSDNALWPNPYEELFARLKDELKQVHPSIRISTVDLTARGSV